jgi:conjugative relaxase-like TrwC/TraI family protein
MHSIASVRSSGGAANYFAADNYYTLEENAEAGVWGGKGAEAAGLSGPVEKDAFEKVLNGELPGGEKVGQVENRRLGIDMTFSMPKSASILALVSGDRRILDANMRAVVKTMQYAERNFAEARNYDTNRNGSPEKTGNLLYALFAHDTSRALDPQGHIHAVVANLTQTASGVWKALWNEKLWHNNTTIGQVYHAALRAELQNLGYELQASGKHGTFEIKGVPKDLRDAFSSRTQDITKEIEKWNATDPRDQKRITLYTRDDKIVLEDRGALERDWQAVAASFGFDGQPLIDAARARAAELGRPSLIENVSAILSEMRERFGAASAHSDPLTTGGVKALALTASQIRAEHATASAVRHLGEREAAFTPEAILSTALGFQVKGVEAHHIELRIGQLIGGGALIRGLSDRADGHFSHVTTPQALAMEQRVLENVAAGADKGRSFMAPEQAAERLQEAARALGNARAGSDGWTLNQGQLAAGIAILAGRDRFLNIQGVAGAGKSTLIGALDLVLKDEGVRLVGLAFQNKMVADLRGGASQTMSVEDMKSAGIEAYTIASFVNRYDRASREPGSPRFDAARADLGNTVIITDESSMVSTRDMLRVQGIAERLEVDKAPFIGDRNQLSAIEQGKMFAVIQAAGHPTVCMDENIRQRNSPLLMAVAGLSNEGHASLALDLLAAHGRVTQAGPDSIRTTAGMWLALPAEERERTAIFTAGRADRSEINMLVQEGLKAEGTLTGDPVALRTLQSANTTREELRFASTYSSGQVLEARMAVREIGLARGQWDVARVHRNGTIELVRHGQRKTIDPARIDPNHRFDRLGLYDRKDLKLHDGDTIFWRDKDAKLDIQKSTYARVLKADGAGITVELADKRAITLPTGHPMLERLDLGYALNAHMVQGMTKPQAIEHISSRQTNLATQRTQNVLNTRATDDMRVVTDDLEKLKNRLDHNAGNKTSALEAVGKVEVDPKPRNPIDTREVPELRISPELRARLDAVASHPPAPVRQLPVPEKSIGFDLA